jgi:DNA replication protein DnaC
LREKEYECSNCEDTGSVFGSFVDEFSGQQLECMKPCACLEPKRLKFILNQMPSLYQTADLHEIQPWVHKHKKQEVVLAKVKQEPFKSYLFLGNSGVGKSYIAWAMWKNAAIKGRRAISTTAAELMQEYRELEVADSVEDFRPRVLPSDLAQQQFKYTIFIDEIEKMRVSPFSMEKLFQLIKNVVDYQHQLIVTSNMREIELKNYFGQLDKAWGAAIMRRLTENVTVVEMWK